MPKISEAVRASRRGEILRAAEACFARLGFHRATMRDVIAESGLSAGCVYTHFTSKADLVAAIAASRHATESAAIARTGRSGDPVAALRAIARQLVGALFTPEGVATRRVGVQSWAEALLDDKILEHVIEGVHAPVERIAAIVAAGQKSGRLDDTIAPETLARALVAIFHGVVLQKLWEPELDLEPLLAAFDVVLARLAREGA